MSSIDDTFERLTAGMRITSRDPEAVALVADAIDETGSLPEPAAAELAIRIGCSRATIHRIKRRVVAEREPLPEPANSFEALEMQGASGFYFDEPMLVVYRILGCNQSRLREALIDAGYPAVSKATISRRLGELPPRISDGVKYGHKNRYRFQLTRRFESAAPYDLFQVDEFHLPIDVLVPVTRGETLIDEDGERVEVCQPAGPGSRRYKVVQPRLLLLIDSYSRYVMSFAVLYKKAATMVDTLALFADAFLVRDVEGCLVGGAPDMIGTDNGGALVGSLVQSFLQLVPTGLDIALGYSPQSPSKAKVEANGQPIKAMLTVGLAGRRSEAETRDGYDMAALDPSLLLTCDQFTAHAQARFREWNFERTHTSTGQVPFDRLTTSGVLGRPVADPVLAACFLPNDVARPDRLWKGGIRIVDKEGVKLRDGTYHQSIGFFDHIGKKVEVRTLHHNDDYAAAFTPDGTFIDFVKHPDVWTEEDDRERAALAVEASATIDRVQRSARDFVAAAPVSNPEELAQAAVELAVKGTAVAEAKQARRDVARPDLGPARRRQARAAAVEEAANDTSDLEAALAAMNTAEGPEADERDEDRP